MQIYTLFSSSHGYLPLPSSNFYTRLYSMNTFLLWPFKCVMAPGYNLLGVTLNSVLKLEEQLLLPTELLPPLLTAKVAFPCGGSTNNRDPIKTLNWSVKFSLGNQQLIINSALT